MLQGSSIEVEDEKLLAAVDFLINPRALGNGLVYFLGTLTIGVPLSRAAVVALAIYCAVRFHYGRRIVEKVGVVLLGFALLVWIQLLPPLPKWQALILSAFPV